MNLFAGTDGGFVIHPPAAAVNCDLRASNAHALTIAADTTITVSNPTIGQLFLLRLTVPASGPSNLYWFAGITWYANGIVWDVARFGSTVLVACLCTGVGTYDAVLFLSANPQPAP